MLTLSRTQPTQLRYTDSSGEVLGEDFLPVFVIGAGAVDTAVGQALVDHGSEMADASGASVDALRASLDTLYAIAFQYATDQSGTHGDEVSRRRQRDVSIQIEDLARWREARTEAPKQRLMVYLRRLALGENMDVLIRREESLLDNVEQTYQDRKRELESQLAVVSQAPELLNLAFIITSPTNNQVS